MNKKFSTLLMGLAMLGSVSASAAVEKGKLHTVKVGSSFLTIEKTKAGADSLALVSLSNPDAVLSAEYKKTLWKFEEVSTGVSNYDKLYKITNYGTGAVLSLDLAKASAKTGAFVVADGNSAWNVDGGQINIKKDGSIYTFATATIGDKTALTFQKKPETAQAFDIAPANKILAMNAEQLNGLYNTSFVLNFAKEMEGNPLDGAAVVAEQAYLTNGDSIKGYLNFKYADGSYLVVDTNTWTQSTNKTLSYYKLTTDKMSATTTQNFAKHTVYANGRAARFYAFNAELNVEDGYVVKITPNAVPVLCEGAKTNVAERTVPCFQINQNGVKPLSYGSFAGGSVVMAALADASDISAFAAAQATIGEVSAPASIDKNYTYYIKNAKTVGKHIGKYYVYNVCRGVVELVSSVTDVPADLWYLNSTKISNMLATGEVKGGSFITLIDEETSTYAFGTDTLQLVKGPKVATVQANSYKNVSKDDYVNGALSFMLKSELAEDLYLCEKSSGALYVEAAELADAAKFKVVPVSEDPVTTVGHNIVVSKYTITNRLGTKVLAYSDGQIVMADASKTTPAPIAFEYLGAENEYKIVFVDEEQALAAKAGSGVTFLTGLCDLENTTFVFAKKEAPSYGKPEIGHVKITTLEDDGKYLASQKDGYAALKAEGQSLKSEDVYTADTLTMWLDTACV